MNKDMIIAVAIAAGIAIIFIEGKVYSYGALTYSGAALVEVGLFLMGVIVGKSYVKGALKRWQ